MLRVTMFNPALPAPYAVNAGCTIDAARDEMLTTAPPPAVSTITGTTSRVSRNGAIDVEAERLLEPVCARPQRGPGRPAAGVVHEDVDAAELLDRRGDEVLELVALEHVGRDDERPPPRRPHPLGGGLEVGLGARRAHHVGPGLGEGHRGAGTDALARAGHDGHPVGQLELVEDHGRTVGVGTPSWVRARRWHGVWRGSAARAGSTGTGAGSCTPRTCPQRAWFEHYATLLRHRRDQQHLLPAAPAVDRRGVGRAGAAGVRVRAQARPVRVAPHEAARRGELAARTTSTGWSGSARTSARTSCSSRPAGSATSSGSTSSSRSRPSATRWAVELREPSWLHDDVFALLERHGAALCIHDLLADHPWERTTDWTYVRFHGPDALEEKYHGRYGGRRLWRVADRLSTWLDEGCRRLRLLQQRLRRPRGRRRPLARGPAHAGAGATSWVASTR